MCRIFTCKHAEFQLQEPWSLSHSHTDQLIKSVHSKHLPILQTSRLCVGYSALQRGLLPCHSFPTFSAFLGEEYLQGKAMQDVNRGLLLSTAHLQAVL